MTKRRRKGKVLVTMIITATKGTPSTAGVELVVYLVSKDKFLPVIKDFSDHNRQTLERLAKTQEFAGEAGKAMLCSGMGGIRADHVLFIGLGEKKKEALRAALREAGGIAVQYARRLGARTVAVDVRARELALPNVLNACVQGALLANYAFDVYKKDNGKKVVLQTDFLFADGRMAQNARRMIKEEEAINAGVTVARDLVNVPAHDMTPERLAQVAQEIAKNSGGTIKAKILQRAECEKLGMGAYLAVAQGAQREPKFIHLTYVPPRNSKKVLAMVGKGVTFDSGGLSLKPADGMMTMKCDMAGAAAVLGAFTVFSDLKPAVHVHGVIAATENMPSGGAIRPGDVVKSMNGKTIEILNTDAEGRLTLADALTYVLKEKPTAIVDLATLTGACMVALGEEVAGIMSNSSVLAKTLQTVARKEGEEMWELPLFGRYAELLKSDIADIKNITSTRYGGTLTAGLFLQEFVPSATPWAHLDIAGPAFIERPVGACFQKGGTGYGVRTLVGWVMGA